MNSIRSMSKTTFTSNIIKYFIEHFRCIVTTLKNFDNEPFNNAVAYVTLYDSGKLLEVRQCEISSLDVEATKNITATFKTNDIDDYKIFVCDPATTLKPLSQVTE